MKLIFAFLAYYCKIGRRIRQVTEDDLFGYLAWIVKKGCTAKELSANAACMTDFFHVLLQEGMIQVNPLFKVYRVLLAGDKPLDGLKTASSLYRFKDINSQQVHDLPARHEAIPPFHRRIMLLRFGWTRINGRKILLFVLVVLAYIMIYINARDVSWWQTLMKAWIVSENIPETVPGKSDRKNDKKIEFFYQNNMKNYYCRDYLKSACSSMALLVNPIAENVENVYEGGKYYAQYCARCHGDDGRGNGPDAIHQTVPTKKLGWAGDGILERDAYLFWTIAKGDDAFGGSMPQFRDILSERAIWQVILFLKTLR
ncbi:MAG: c-type cytochrome [Magnetococcales bacterium]|nr:c-type cytochrome [Magnetococcales bacterium]